MRHGFKLKPDDDTCISARRCFTDFGAADGQVVELCIERNTTECYFTAIYCLSESQAWELGKAILAEASTSLSEASFV